MKKQIYFENLDGLRFFCFLSVFIFHSFRSENLFNKQDGLHNFLANDIFGNGNIGVNFFFVLSGFLITFLLIEEKKMNGQIAVRKFWLRRILRIWPVFYFCVALGFFIYPMIRTGFGKIYGETANLIYYLTFTNNFDLIKMGLPNTAILGALWSIAVEEQFYFVWPILIFLVPLKRLWLPFIGLILSSLIFRALNDQPRLHEIHTLSCMGDLTIGAIGAWLISMNAKFKSFMEDPPNSLIALIYILFFGAYLFRDEVLYSNYSIRIFERMIIATIIIFIILEQSFSKNSFFKVKNFKQASRLGIITYGLYCLHFVGIIVVTNISKWMAIEVQLWQFILVNIALGFLITLVLSKLSYRYFEHPFLKLKRKYTFIGKRSTPS